MPPNAKLEGIVQIALPFSANCDQPTYNKEGPSLEGPSAVYYSGSSVQHQLGDDDEPGVRITTRARFTYELDRFKKHAALIIINSYACVFDVSIAVTCALMFDRHRFDYTFIDTENDSREENWQKIYQFFQQDFSSIGAVAVATLSCDVDTENSIKEWDVLNYLISNQPSALQDKPKIFISEALEPSSPPPVTNLPSDILILQAKKDQFEKGGVRPLSLLCYKLNSMKEPKEFFEILSELRHETTYAIPKPTPISCTHTLSKELLLHRDNQCI